MNSTLDITQHEAPLLKTPEAAFQLKTALLTHPFQKLAMALSGGGFRAGAYSLGAMSYLHHLRYPNKEDAEKRVLDNVEFVASASGGTFAGIMYTMHVRQGIKFEDTFSQLFKFLNGQLLLGEVLARIGDPQPEPDAKSANLINAFARSYDEKLFNKETFGVYWANPKDNNARPIEVCFNSTEFYRGISFRFQASNVADFFANVGNKYVFFDKKQAENTEVLKKIKLGDIMAASSCFPAGFEPILFPRDFTYDGVTKTELKKALNITNYDNERIDYSENIGLMDGGINDNQGVYSAMLADIRRRKKDANNGFDLVFITDVGSYFMDPYVAPALDTAGDFNSLSIDQLLGKSVKSLLPAKYGKAVTWVLIIALVLFALSASLIWCCKETICHDIALAVASISAFTVLLVLLINKLLLKKVLKSFLPEVFSQSGAALVSTIKKNVPALKNFSDKNVDKLATWLQNIKIGALVQMLMARANSMLSMVLEINLKQTRRLIFGTLYGEFYGKDIWQNRRVFNVIYELSTQNEKSRAAILENKFFKEYLIPGPDGQKWAKEYLDTLTTNCRKLEVIAESARTMGTTLWSDEEDTKNERIRDVISCGQFTTCVKLLEYCFTVEIILKKQELDPAFPKQILLDDEQMDLFTKIKKQLLDDWEMFKTKPNFVFDEYAPIPNPEK